MVAEYAGMSLNEVREMDYLMYLTLRRDAFIHKMNQTEKGREYLDNAWRMEQTKPDRAALRRKLRKEEPILGK
jgi:predicted RNA polymerase sigma factor